MNNLESQFQVEVFKRMVRELDETDPAVAEMIHDHLTTIANMNRLVASELPLIWRLFMPPPLPPSMLRSDKAYLIYLAGFVQGHKLRAKKTLAIRFMFRREEREA